MELVGGGSVINGDTPSRSLTTCNAGGGDTSVEDLDMEFDSGCKDGRVTELKESDKTEIQLCKMMKCLM